MSMVYDMYLIMIFLHLYKQEIFLKMFEAYFPRTLLMVSNVEIKL